MCWYDDAVVSDLWLKHDLGCAWLELNLGLLASDPCLIRACARLSFDSDGARLGLDSGALGQRLTWASCWLGLDSEVTSQLTWACSWLRSGLDGALRLDWGVLRVLTLACTWCGPVLYLDLTPVVDWLVASCQCLTWACARLALD